MQDFLRNNDCLKQADTLACNGRPSEFVELLEPGIQNKAQMMQRNSTVSSSFPGLLKTKRFLSETLLNKFSEWTKKLEEIQKQCPESEKVHLSEQITYFSGVLENVFDLCSKLDVGEEDLQRYLTEQTELLMQNFIKIDKLPELSLEDLQVLGEFETIMPPEDWQEVMDSACELLEDFEITNDTTVQLSAHQNHLPAGSFQKSHLVETVEKSLEKCIGQQDEFYPKVAASTSRSSSTAIDVEKDLRNNANYQSQKEIGKDEQMKNCTAPKKQNDCMIPRCQGENVGIQFVRRSPRFQNRRG